MSYETRALPHSTVCISIDGADLSCIVRAIKVVLPARDSGAAATHSTDGSVAATVATEHPGSIDDLGSEPECAASQVLQIAVE